ncbi:MAG: hypothetical protein ABI720_06405 [Actinomycetes bacterium]
MKRIVHGALALLIVVGGLVVMTGSAQACSCAGGSDAKYFEWAEAVFAGEIVDRTGELRSKSQTQSGQTVYGGGSFTYTVAVDAVYKGEVDATQKFVAGTQGSACGLVLPKSGPILVYGFTSKKQASGDGAPEHYGTGSCSGTAATPAVPASFGAGEPPIGAETSPPPSAAPLPTAPPVDIGTATGSTWAVMFGIALLASLVVVGAVYLSQRRRP